MIFDLLTSPQGHQFDHSVEILLVFCSTYYPRQFDMSHDHVGKKNFLTPGYPGASSPTPSVRNGSSGRVFESRLRDGGFEPHRRHCIKVPENHKNIGFSSITGLDFLKITKLQSQYSMWAIFGLPAKRHFNGVSRVAGWPIMACSRCFLAPRSPRKTKQKETCQSWTPSEKNFWIRAWCFISCISHWSM